MIAPDRQIDEGERPSGSLRRRAYERFTRHLLARNIKAGQFVSQRELAALTELPLGAIRELIPRLETEGLIRTVPQRGMQVAHVDLNLIRDTFQLRLFIERGATALFVTQVSASVLDRLQDEHVDIIRRYDDGVAKGPFSSALLEAAEAVEWNFHSTIVDTLGNEIISETYRVNAIKMRLIRYAQTWLSEAVLVATMEDHLAMIATFRKHDPASAVGAMEAHIQSAQKRALASS